ncbi:unnamed protein product [Amoebophrya sp. A120]|nr:unnamed protein product [Amoebophrya sp. A120]|eukprot:GSA120T00015870001.1
MFAMAASSTPLWRKDEEHRKQKQGRRRRVKLFHGGQLVQLRGGRGVQQVQQTSSNYSNTGVKTPHKNPKNPPQKASPPAAVRTTARTTKYLLDENGGGRSSTPEEAAGTQHEEGSFVLQRLVGGARFLFHHDQDGASVRRRSAAHLLEEDETNGYLLRTAPKVAAVPRTLTRPTARPSAPRPLLQRCSCSTEEQQRHPSHGSSSSLKKASKLHSTFWIWLREPTAFERKYGGRLLGGAPEDDEDVVTPSSGSNALAASRSASSAAAARQAAADNAVSRAESAPITVQQVQQPARLQEPSISYRYWVRYIFLPSLLVLLQGVDVGTSSAIELHLPAASKGLLMSSPTLGAVLLSFFLMFSRPPTGKIPGDREVDEVPAPALHDLDAASAAPTAEQHHASSPRLLTDYLQEPRQLFRIASALFFTGNLLVWKSGFLVTVATAKTLDTKVLTLTTTGRILIGIAEGIQLISLPRFLRMHLPPEKSNTLTNFLEFQFVNGMVLGSIAGCFFAPFSQLVGAAASPAGSSTASGFAVTKHVTKSAFSVATNAWSVPLMLPISLFLNVVWNYPTGGAAAGQDEAGREGGRDETAVVSSPASAVAVSSSSSGQQDVVATRTGGASGTTSSMTSSSNTVYYAQLTRFVRSLQPLNHEELLQVGETEDLVELSAAAQHTNVTSSAGGARTGQQHQEGGASSSSATIPRQHDKSASFWYTLFGFNQNQERVAVDQNGRGAGETAPDVDGAETSHRQEEHQLPLAEPESSNNINLQETQQEPPTETEIMRKAVFASTVVMFTQALVGHTSGILPYAQEFLSPNRNFSTFSTSTLSGATTVPSPDLPNPQRLSLSIFIFKLFATLHATTWFDNFGKRQILLNGVNAVGLTYALASIFTELKSQVLTTVTILASVISYQYSIGPVSFAYVGELFPEKFHLQAGSFMMFLNSAGNAAVTYFTPRFPDKSAVLLFFSVNAAISYLLVDKFLPETHRLTLQEVQKLLASGGLYLDGGAGVEEEGMMLGEGTVVMVDEDSVSDEEGEGYHVHRENSTRPPVRQVVELNERRRDNDGNENNSPALGEGGGLGLL